jgi:hypothetical protein
MVRDPQSHSEVWTGDCFDRDGLSNDLERRAVAWECIFHVINNAAEWYFKNHDHTCPIFALVYEALTLSLGLSSHGMGAQWHKTMVSQKASESVLLHIKGDNLKLDRWYSYFKRSRVWKPCRIPLLLALVPYGLKKKWWNHISETPFYSSRHLEGADPDAYQPAPEVLEAMAAEEVSAKRAGADSDLVGRRTVKESNKVIERVKAGFENDLHFMTSVCANEWSSQLQDLMTEYVEPYEIMHGHHLVLSKTQRGGKQYRMDMAVGGWMKPVQQCFDKFADAKSLAYIGFTSDMCVGEDVVAQQQFLATIALRFTVNLAAMHAEWSASYSWTLPKVLVQLLDPREDKRQEFLRKLQHWWTILTTLERIAWGNKRCQDFYDHLIWPNDTFVREIMIFLLEVDFKAVPREVEIRMEDYAASFSGDNATERGFGVQKNKQKHSQRGQIGIIERWHVLVARNLLKDYDRRAVQVTDQIKAETLLTNTA